MTQPYPWRSLNAPLARTTGKSLATGWTPVPILMYHAVEDEPRPAKYKHFYVTASEFAFHIRWLKTAGYQPISLDTLLSAMDGKAALPDKPIVLTFDDGYENLIRNAAPLLAELGWPYTVFLVSERIGQRNEWVVAEGYEPTPLLSWPQIHELSAQGFARFQPHTVTHPRLKELDEPMIRREIADCRDQLQDRLQTAMNCLCYPYGDYSPRVIEVAREEGMLMAVTTEFGRVRRNDDRFALPRVSIYHVPPVSLTYGIGPINFMWRVATRNDTRRARQGK